jgi:hypothetical protein
MYGSVVTKNNNFRIFSPKVVILDFFYPYGEDDTRDHPMIIHVLF